MFANCYRDLPVLVTGCSGFKGAWLCAWLRRLGADVSGLALAAPTSPSLFEDVQVRLDVRYFEADVRDGAAVQKCFDEVRPKIVFHLAAAPLVRESYRQPRETFDVNVVGTVSVLESLRKAEGTVAAVIVSTDKVYENREWDHEYRELDPLGGKDPYSASKAAMELVLKSYQASFYGSHAVRVASARAGNVIGGGDFSSERIIPDAVRAATQGITLDIRNPDSTRPWQHVLEPLAGYLWLGAQLLGRSGPTYAEPWNFGPRLEDQRRVAELVDAFFQAWGKGKWKHLADASNFHEAKLLKLSFEKARARLGWQPVWPFAVAVDRTAAWYRVYFAEGPRAARARLEADIAEYESAAAAAGISWTREPA